MKRQILRLVAGTAIAGAGLLAFGAPAQAAQISFGNSGVGSGNQFSSVIQAPVSVCGNAIPEPGEECDDGDFDNGDGCSASCLSEDVGCPDCDAGVEPDSGSPEPDAGSPEPDSGTPESDAGTPESDAGTLDGGL